MLRLLHVISKQFRSYSMCFTEKNGARIPKTVARDLLGPSGREGGPRPPGTLGKGRGKGRRVLQK